MRRILDKVDQRTILIIEKLIKEDSWVTIKSLANHVESSIRTTKCDLDIVKNNWEQILDIETSIQYGVKANNKSEGILKSIARDIFTNSTPLLLLNNFFRLPFLTKEEHCEKLSISFSLFFQYLSRIREKLKRLGADIQIKNGGYFVFAKDEMKLRIFITNFLIETHEHRENFIAHKNESIIHLMKEGRGSTKHLNFDNIDFEFIYFHTLFEVSFIREGQGFSYYSYINEGYPDMSIVKKLKVEFPAINEDIVAKVVDFFDRDLYSWDSEEEKTRVHRLIKDLIVEFYERLQVKEREKNSRIIFEVLERMYLSSKDFDFDPSPLFNRDKYFTRVYKNNYRETYDIIQVLFQEFSEKTNVNFINLIDSTIYWLCIHCNGFLEYRPKKMVLVLSDLGPSHYKMIKNQIDKRFNKNEEYLKVDYETYGNRSKIIKNNYNLIISTYPVEIEGSTKVLVIDDNINYKVLYQMEEVLYGGN